MHVNSKLTVCKNNLHNTFVCIYVCMTCVCVSMLFYHTILTDAFLYWYPTGDSPQYTAENVQDMFRTGGGSLIPHPQTYVHIHVQCRMYMHVMELQYAANVP